MLLYGYKLMLVGFEPTPASAFSAYSVCKPLVGYYLLLCLPIHQATRHSSLQCPMSSLVPYRNTLRVDQTLQDLNLSTLTGRAAPSVMAFYCLECVFIW